MSLNGLPGITPAGRVDPSTSAPQGVSPARSERPVETYAEAKLDSSGGGGGLAESLQASLRQLGLGSAQAGANPAQTDKAGSPSKSDIGHLMQALFQAVQAHSPPLTNGESASFAAALASLTAQMSSDDSLSSLQAAVGRVLDNLQSAQAGAARSTPNVQDLLSTLQRNLDHQTNVVQTKGNVLNTRA